MNEAKASVTRTLDQQRAAHAWACIEGMKGLKSSPAEKDQKTVREFGIQLKKLPTRIMAAGLGQALAFLHAKEYAPQLVETLNEWTSDHVPGSDKEKQLLVRLIHGDADFQRHATAEVLAYLVWLGRFADGANLTDNAQE